MGLWKRWKTYRKNRTNFRQHLTCLKKHAAQHKVDLAVGASGRGYKIITCGECGHFFVKIPEELTITEVRLLTLYKMGMDRLVLKKKDM